MDKRKVLVVEDEQEVLSAMKDMLERKGCQVFITDKAEVAWDIFQKEHPQAVSIDINLPFSKFDGLELLSRIRQSDKKVYCAVFSCLEAADKKPEAVRLGANDYVEKPLGSQELISLIDNLSGKAVRHG